MSEEFMTWGSLGTYAGAIFFTTTVTQLLKGLGFIAKIPTRIFSYIVAVITLILSQVFTAGASAETIAMCFVNAFLVSLACNGGHDLLQSIPRTSSKLSDTPSAFYPPDPLPTTEPLPPSHVSFE